MADPDLRFVLSRLPVALVLNGALAAVAFGTRTVRPSGAIAGALLGACVLVTAGWRPFILLGAFFILGSLVTRTGWSAKDRRGVAEAHGGARGLRQVVANGAPAAVLAAAYWWSGAPVLLVGYAGALAAASADTTSSELGQIYGSRPVALPVLRAVPVGTPGAVSAAGTAAGAGAAVLVGLAAWALGVVSLEAIPVVAVSALAATMIESLLAPSLSGAAWHHVLNLVNVCAGACLAMGLWAVL